MEWKDVDRVDGRTAVGGGGWECGHTPGCVGGWKSNQRPKETVPLPVMAVLAKV